MSTMNVNNVNENDENKEKNEGCGAAVIGWGILAFIGSLIAGFFLEYSHELGFWRRSLVVLVAVVCGTPGGLIGALIGDVIRKITQPAWSLIEGDAGDILNYKIYWAIGPQLIGLGMGGYLMILATAQQLARYYVQNLY